MFSLADTPGKDLRLDPHEIQLLELDKLYSLQLSEFFFFFFFRIELIGSSAYFPGSFYFNTPNSVVGLLPTLPTPLLPYPLPPTLTTGLD